MAQQRLQSDQLDNFEKCDVGINFLTFKCILVTFTAFPIDNDLSHGLYIKVMKVGMKLL